jgi:hypothetical protein
LRSLCSGRTAWQPLRRITIRAQRGTRDRGLSRHGVVDRTTPSRRARARRSPSRPEPRALGDNCVDPIGRSGRSHPRRRRTPIAHCWRPITCGSHSCSWTYRALPAAVRCAAQLTAAFTVANESASETEVSARSWSCAVDCVSSGRLWQRAVRHRACHHDVVALVGPLRVRIAPIRASPRSSADRRRQRFVPRGGAAEVG